MPNPSPAALDFLLHRRSRPAKTLGLPVPSRDELMPILTVGLRTPDHGKLEPWRLIVLEKPALARLSQEVAACGARLGRAGDEIAKQSVQYANADLVVAVVSCPRASPKIPQIEQTLSAGAVCMQLLNAALAAGWGANWLSGWACHDAEFCAGTLGLAPEEWIAGMIHIGTETSAPPERPRPDPEAVITWITE